MTNLINKLGIGALGLFLAGSLNGCGQIEKSVDEYNYESLSNEKVKHLELYSGGKLIKSFDKVKIIYSNADSYSLWFEDSLENKHYWQGEAFMDF